MSAAVCAVDHQREKEKVGNCEEFGLHWCCRTHSLAANAINQNRMPKHFGLSFNLLTETLGNFDGRSIVRMNQADHVIAVHLLECVIQRSSRTLACIPLAPELPAQHPAKLKAGPA